MKKLYRLEIFDIGIYQWSFLTHDKKKKLNGSDLDILIEMQYKYNNDTRNYPTLLESISFEHIALYGYKITDLYSGCRSIDDLKQWFKGYYELLLGIKYVKLVSYFSPFILNSRTGLPQCFGVNLTDRRVIKIN